MKIKWIIKTGILCSFILGLCYPGTTTNAAEGNKPPEKITSVTFSKINYVERLYPGGDDADILEISGEKNGQPISIYITTEAPRKPASLGILKTCEKLANLILISRPGRYSLKISTVSLFKVNSSDGTKKFRTHLDELGAVDFSVRILRNQKP